MGKLIGSLGLAAGLTATLFLSGCGGGGGGDEAKVFKPLSYGYLTPLRLNVGEIRIEDHAPPPTGPGDLAGESPVPPEQALRRMAQDRLVAAGSSGKAVFSIDQASITGEGGGPLDGTLAVHLDIIGRNGGHAGYAEAHVSRQFVPGSGTDNDGVKGELYNLTVQMMQDMNVEFEFQLRRTLSDWMVDASGAPVAAGVDQQPLTPGGSGPATPPSVGAPVQLAPSSAAVPGGAVQGPGVAMPPGSGAVPTGSALGVPPATDPGAGAPLQLSPQPGFLQPPPGTAPTAPAGPGATGSGYPGQGYPGQGDPNQANPNQGYPAQPYPGQPYAARPYAAQPYPGPEAGPSQPAQTDPGATPPGY